MYVNYGDRNFFEHGRLLEGRRDGSSEFKIIYCEPYPDEEDLYQFAKLDVDIDDPWIDQDAVLKFTGMDTGEFDPIWFALGCVDYYGPENFGAGSWPACYDWKRMAKEDICGLLKYEQISPDCLDICW